MKTFGYSPSVALEDGISDYVAWAKLETSGTKPTL
jgi:nucleoside-diphosphate-sugar epimerase